jgi:Zn-dependent metalloprotease
MTRLYQLPLLVLLNASSLLQYASAKGDHTGGFVFLDGKNLGTLPKQGLSIATLRGTAVTASASTLAGILKKHKGATGRESFSPGKETNSVVTDKQGHEHHRLEQTYQGLPVVDAAMVMHVDAQGQVYAVNGEFVTDGTVDLTVLVTCVQAFANTLADPKYRRTAVWLTKTCNIVIVFDKFGTAHKAWERTIGYQPESGPYQNDKLYASVVTGEIVAVRPQVLGALSLKTQNCNQNAVVTACTTIASNATYVSSNDTAIQDAHRYARAFWNFYWNNFQRDSVNGKGATLTSHVHVGVNYNNAYWNGASVNFGDGDGKSSLRAAACREELL